MWSGSSRTVWSEKPKSSMRMSMKRSEPARPLAGATYQKTSVMLEMVWARGRATASQYTKSAPTATSQVFSSSRRPPFQSRCATLSRWRPRRESPKEASTFCALKRALSSEASQASVNATSVEGSAVANAKPAVPQPAPSSMTDFCRNSLASAVSHRASARLELQTPRPVLSADASPSAPKVSPTVFVITNSRITTSVASRENLKRCVADSLSAGALSDASSSFSASAPAKILSSAADGCSSTTVAMPAWPVAIASVSTERPNSFFARTSAVGVASSIARHFFCFCVVA
mmetsp:Transcript_10262/g.30973  ORF Transcript_10262/g.30973 Transcript_10262/m.30973 type:complete len:289 (-) Transcript_10262:349-1215(-)